MKKGEKKMGKRIELFPELEDLSTLQQGEKVETIVEFLMELSVESLKYISLWIELELERRKEDDTFR